MTGFDDFCHSGDHGGHQKNDDHGILHLIEESRECGFLLGFGQLVLAVAFQTGGGLLGGKARFAGLHFLEYRLNGFQIMLHLHSFLIGFIDNGKLFSLVRLLNIH